jgi:hypothetical protein
MISNPPMTIDHAPHLLWLVLLLAGLGLARFRQKLSWGQALCTGLAALLLSIAALNPQRITQQHQPQPTQLLVLGEASPAQAEQLKQWQAAHPEIAVQNIPLPPPDAGKLTGDLRQLLPSSLASSGGLLIIPDTQRVGEQAVGELADWLRQRHIAGHLWLNPPGESTDGAGASADAYRLEILSAPSFALVGQAPTIQVKLLPPSTPPAPAANLVLVVEGERGAAQSVTITADQAQEITLPPLLPGTQQYRLVAKQADGTVLAGNPQQLLTLNGITQRLRILLVSSQPWAGGRVWRELLKSDPAVDLVHFTILRRPTSRDPANSNELALIPFPVDQLFGQQLNQFDLVVFDQDTANSPINPDVYGPALQRYVENGGALLVQMGTSSSEAVDVPKLPGPLLAPLLPVKCQAVLAKAFAVEPSQISASHPITQLFYNDNPRGRWNQGCIAGPNPAAASAASATTLLQDKAGHPMLVVASLGKGRIAQLLSDDLWLWNRQVDGGGPARPLLRNLIGWLRHENAFEARELIIDSDDNSIFWRQEHAINSDAPEPPPITVSEPDGTDTVLEWQKEPTSKPADAPLWSTSFPRVEDGLYSFTTNPQDPQKIARYFVMKETFVESDDRRPADLTAWKNLAEQSGGLVLAADASLPEPILLKTPPDQSAQKAGFWLRQNLATQLLSSQKTPIIPLAFLLVPALLLLLASWLGRVGRRK